MADSSLSESRGGQPSGSLWRTLLAEALSAPPSTEMSMRPRPMPPLGTQIVGRTAEGRPIVLNPDGSFSTERSTTMQFDDGFMNFPTMFGGREYPPDDAANIMESNRWIDPETGRRAVRYPTLEEALLAAGRRSSGIR